MDRSSTDRTQVKRRSQRGHYDRATIDAILDEALVCHVGFVAPHGPVVLPTTFVRVGDHVYLHGAVSNAMLASATDVCIEVTLVDALVLGKSAMHHSMNYRSVVAFGRAARITDPDAKLGILAELVDKVEPGRSERCRPPNPQELAITQIVGVPITEASAKIRTGPPIDDAADADLPYWAGLIPLHTLRGSPITTPGTLSGATPGTLSGSTPAKLSGSTPGTLSGSTPGTRSNTTPGTLSGSTPGTTPGSTPGTSRK